MKKIFMMATAAALAIGMAACSNTPGGEDPVGGKNATAMGISITLPAGMGTRANTPIDGSAAENAVKTLDVWVFDGNGNAPTDAALGYRRWDATTFLSDFTSSGQTYTGTVSFPTIAGSVKVYVGLNLPSDFGSTPFVSDTKLKEAFDDVADLSGDIKTTGIAMFTDVKTGTLETVPSNTPAAALPSANRITLEAYRAVAKLTTTVDTSTAANYTVTWSAADGVTPTLIYTVKHWYVFQSATSTFVAANYSVDNYVTGNGTTPTAAPATQAPGGYTAANGDNPQIAPFYHTYSYLSTYKDDGTLGGKLNLNQGVGASAGTDSKAMGETAAVTAANVNAKYIGENAGVTGTGWGSATYAFISTGLVVNAAVNWDTATKAIKWETVSGNYGNGMTGEDIYLIRYNNKQYLTNTATKLSDIRTGVALNNHQVVITENPQPRNDGFIEKTFAQFDSEYGFETFIYEDGYVHFPFFMGQGVNNNPRAYDVLRNQFIHLNVTGMNKTNVDGIFPGYPGQTSTKWYPGAQASNNVTNSPNQGNPAVPIDIAQADNNPAPHNPTEPIIQVQTALAVTVNVNPWTYKVVPGKLGR